ncbi:MAG: heavy-metal-associated domain-containing protein [Alkalilacustris sp.]
MQFHIENMTCGGCVRGVTQAIRSVDPEAGIDADPPSRNLVVRSPKPGAAFLPALHAAGFDATVQQG